MPTHSLLRRTRTRIMGRDGSALRMMVRSFDEASSSNHRADHHEVRRPAPGGREAKRTDTIAHTMTFRYSNRPSRRRSFLCRDLVVSIITVVALSGMPTVVAFTTSQPPSAAAATVSYRDDGDGGRRNRLLIVGLGRVGLEVAHQAQTLELFSSITATVRHRGVPDDQRNDDEKDNSSTDHLNFKNNNDGIERVVFGLSSLQHRWQDVSHASHILFTLPAPTQDDALTWDVISNVLVPAIFHNSDNDNDTPLRSKWIGILSTTGLYGNHNGNWVNEESECFCSTANDDDVSSSCQSWLDWGYFWKQQQKQQQSLQHRHASSKVRIFRCAGIYGNTRSALHTTYQKKQKKMTVLTSSTHTSNNSKDNDITNRIHEEDLASAIVSCMVLDDHPSDNLGSYEIFNLADDLPESRTTVMEYAESLLVGHGVNLSPTQRGSVTSGSATLPSTAATSRRSRRRQSDRKRVSNAKMKKYLLPQLKYPSYREGLASVLQHPDAPWHKKSSTTSRS